MVLKNIKEYVKNRKEELKNIVENLKHEPTLVIVQVGDNEASNRYVRNKVKDCEEVGIEAQVYYFPEDIEEEELKHEIECLQPYADGLIVQLPLPPHINYHYVTSTLWPEKDVDGFLKYSPYVPATPKGIMDYLKYCEFDVDGKLVVIIGRSDIVGKPLAKLMTDANATVALCHSHTTIADMNILTMSADLVISAVGKAEFLDCIGIGCPVIDVGINFDESGKLVGDCYNTKGREDITPVPGGVGLLTRLALLENTVRACGTVV